MASESPHVKSCLTRAKRARINAAAIRGAAAKPGNFSIRCFLLKEADKYDGIANASELRATKLRNEVR